MRPLDPLSLRLFVSVAERGTVARAAEHEHIAAAAISKRISDLEAILGTPLLTRTNKGVEVTAAGQALLTLARRALYELEQIPLQMRDFENGVRGLVRVCASMSAITQFLPHDLRSFLGRYPDVRIDLEEVRSADIQRSVEQHAADIGIFTSVPQSEQLLIRPYHRDRLAACFPRSHRLAGRQSVRFVEFADEDVLGMHTGSATAMLLAQAAGGLERPLRGRFRATSFDALCMMVHCGLGVGVLPEAIARRNAASLELAVSRLDEPWAQRDFHLALRPSGQQSEAARLLAVHLGECASRASSPSGEPAA